MTSNGRAALSGRPRLLPLAAASPARNMAIDAALLATATRPTLRFYLWRPNGVSLGRFQDAAAAAPFREAGLPVVRRMTGGGAIVHADEITYSILLPDDHALLLGLDVKASYAALHRPIREALASLGVATETRDVPVPTHKARDLLCFARATELDLVARDKKIVGSAQRRVPGRVLQHGSILLSPHPLQPGTASVSEVLGRVVPPTEAAAALEAAFSDRLGGLESGALTEDEERAADAAEPSCVVAPSR